MPPAPAPQNRASGNETLQLSGMEFVQQMLDGLRPGAPIGRVLGFGIHAAEPGIAIFRGRAGGEHTNPMGGVHGGWYGSILDSALGCAVMTTVPRGFWYTTLEYKVNLTRALPPGIEVEARAEVQHAGRSTAVASATLRGLEDGRVYATGSTTCIIIPG